MKLTFLGTSAGSPTRQRNVTGLALIDGPAWDLFDCGEATQHQIQRTSLSLTKLRRVYISHLHGDHCFGLFGLLGSRSMDVATTPLTVFGPEGLKRMLDTVLEASATHLTYPLNVIELGAEGGRVVDEADSTVEALPLSHRVTSFAWSITEPESPGSFDVAAAKAAGVPEGPLFGVLRRGESVTLDDGTVVSPDGLVSAPRPGRHIVIAGDNNDPDSLFARTGGADVAVHEATFTEDVLAKMPDDRGHSTADRVGRAAATHGVRNLVLTHFSPRYATTDELRSEAEAQFSGGLHLAEDFDTLDITIDGDAVPRSS